MLAAMMAVLGYVAIESNVIKITFESFPLLLAGLMFGPMDGLMVGFVGTFIYQILKYGFAPTTILWILPYCVAGIVLGVYAKKYNYKNTPKQMLFIVIVAELIITVMNTGVIYLDSVINHYWFPGIVSANLIMRLVVCIAEGIVFGLVIPKITTAVKKVLK